jgi:hypothetical protein
MKPVFKFNLAAACLLAYAAFAAGSTDKSVKVDGWISESGCGAEHASSKGANATCVAKCIKEGAKPIFVDDAKQQVWSIDNPDSIKEHYGHHIQMTGTADAQKKEVHITKVTMLADQGAKTDTMMK